MESLVRVVTVQDGFCYFSLAFGECGYSIFQLNHISHHQFSQEVIWEERKGVFSLVCKMPLCSYIMNMLFFVILF